MKRDNLDADVSYLRDTFLTAERDYVIHLIETSSEIRNLILEFNSNFTSESLFKKAKELIDLIDYGQISEKEMNMIEKKLIVILAAIQDKTLIEKIKLLNTEAEALEGESSSMHR